MVTEKKYLGSPWETRIAGLRKAWRGAILPPPLFPASKKEQGCSLFFASFAFLPFAPKRADTSILGWRHLHPVHFLLKNGHRANLGLSLGKRLLLTASPCRGSCPARAQDHTHVPCWSLVPPEDTPYSVRSRGSLVQQCRNT